MCMCVCFVVNGKTPGFEEAMPEVRSWANEWDLSSRLLRFSR